MRPHPATPPDLTPPYATPTPTPTPIATFEDILAAMENNPRLQAAMRQHILDQEFLQLPAIVRELQQTVARLAQLVHEYIAANDERQEQIEARLDRLEAGQARLEQDVAELKTGQAELKAGQARLGGNMNRLMGSDYERKAARRASRLAQRYLHISAIRVIYAITAPDDNRLPELLDRAVAAGRIDVSEAGELENADIVMSGSGHYAVAEVSVTLDESDVQRARERADLLAKATMTPVRATVIGAYALDAAVRSASANEVAIMFLPE